MDVGAILKKTELLLKPTSTSVRLDSELLLSHLLQKDRSWVHTHPEHILQRSDLCKLDEMVERRVSGESIAYILGYKEFYGRNFIVNSDVLVPRPESESFIEMLGDLAKVRPPQGIHNVLDMGTGSGCLAVTTKLEYPHLNVFASDISKAALQVAIKNSQEYKVPITFKIQSLLNNDKQGYDVIIANLPYVPESMKDKSIMSEPPEALFSGSDGLKHYTRLFEQLEPKHIRYVLLESLLLQHDSISKLAIESGYKLTRTDGLVQLFTKVDAP